MLFTAIATAISLILAYSYGLYGLVYLAADILFSYLLGILIEKRRFVLWISVVLHSAVLVVLRLGFLDDTGFAAPVGISYFTLLIISYHADVYRGRYKADRDLLSYALYICYFPRLLMGPLERRDAWQKALDDGNFSLDNLLSGGTRVLWGLFKQLVVAARAASVVSVISGASADYKGAYALLAVVLYSVELYADFSGAMDIVIGISRIFGIRLPENFDRPYFSESVQEFWRRWHMTLGAWLREYVYFPLGGSRKGKLRKVFNTLAVFVVSGFWHGSQYLLWGIFNGIFVIFGEKLKTGCKALNRIGTFMLVTLMWAFFVWPSSVSAIEQLLSIFTVFNYGEMFSGFFTLGLDLSQWLIFAAGLMIMWAYDIFRDGINEKIISSRPSSARVLALACLLAVIVMTFGMYGIGFNAEAFIYSRF